MESILQASGRRVTPGVGYHRILISEAERLLDADEPELFEQLNDARATRADASYHAGIVADSDVADVRSAAERLVGLASAHLERGR